MIFATLMTGSFTKAKLGNGPVTVLVHCENALICDELRSKREGRVIWRMIMSPHVRYLLKWKLPVACCIWRKRQAAARHVCHISSPEGRGAQRARVRKVRMSPVNRARTIFVLDTDQFEEIGTGKMFSPIRTVKTRKDVENRLTAKSTARYPPTTLHARK